MFKRGAEESSYYSIGKFVLESSKHEGSQNLEPGTFKSDPDFEELIGKKSKFRNYISTKVQDATKRLENPTRY